MASKSPLLLWNDYVYIVSCIYHILLSFTLVAVTEDSSTSEIDKKEEEQTTQDPDLITGKCPPQHLE